MDRGRSNTVTVIQRIKATPFTPDSPEIGTTARQVCTLLSLPSEVRSLILTHLFSTARLEITGGDYGDEEIGLITSIFRRDYNPDLLRCCKQLYDEALPVLLSCLTLYFCYVSSEDLDDVMTPQLRRYMQQIRRVEIAFFSNKNLALSDASVHLPRLKTAIFCEWRDWSTRFLPFTEDEDEAQQQLHGSYDEMLKRHGKRNCWRYRG